MTRSPLLDSFDPFATHPFTNNSGLTPPPPLPSLYPSIHSQTTLDIIPTSSSSTQTVNSLSSSLNIQNSPSSSPNIQNTPSFPHLQKQPVPLPSSSPATPSRSPPIFVPYRRDTSSPDLVLKKKKTYPTATQQNNPIPRRSDIPNVRHIPSVSTHTEISPYPAQCSSMTL